MIKYKNAHTHTQTHISSQQWQIGNIIIIDNLVVWKSRVAVAQAWMLMPMPRQHTNTYCFISRPKFPIFFLLIRLIFISHTHVRSEIHSHFFLSFSVIPCPSLLPPIPLPSCHFLLLFVVEFTLCSFPLGLLNYLMCNCVRICVSRIEI